MMRTSIRLVLFALITMAATGLGRAQTAGPVSGVPPPAVAGATAAQSTAATQPGIPPDRRHWPSPTGDTANFGLLLLDTLEYQGTGAFRWDVYGWRGGDYQRLWIKSEGSQSTGDANDNEADLQLLYGKLIFPFVDLQLGGRVATVWGSDSRTTRAFAVVGLQALTPYGFDIEPTLFLSHEGIFSARFTGSYDVLLSQKLIFQPRLETNLSAQPDREFRVGSGLNDLEVSTRFRYEIRREFAPYIGVAWRQDFGDTKILQSPNGYERKGFAVVFGLRIWR